MSQKPQSVGELVNDIKLTLESQYRQVLVRGEISNISRTVAGHVYFTISDNEASASVALFRADALRNSVVMRKLKDGDAVILAGGIGVYGKRGVFQIICKRVMPEGKGGLSLQFELLKSKLAAKGYFDASSKAAVPKMPKKIALITAPYGAALQDFLKIIKRRSLWIDLVIVPAIVQGNESASSVINAINKVEEVGGIDVIVITRGGGAMEDLWSFNDERLIERAWKCRIPIISAIGHEVDYTLLDYVADLRLETPSAAAEYLSQAHTEIFHRLENYSHKLRSLLYRHQRDIQNRLQRVHPRNMLSKLESLLSSSKMRLERQRLLERKDLWLRVTDKEMLIGDLLERAKRSLDYGLKEQERKLKSMDQLLSSINPSNVLKRGFAYLEDPSGRVIATTGEYDKLENDKLIVHFFDGKRNVLKEGNK